MSPPTDRRVVDDMTLRAPLKNDCFGAKAALEVMRREPMEAMRVVFIIVVLGNARVGMKRDERTHDTAYP